MSIMYDQQPEQLLKSPAIWRKEKMRAKVKNLHNEGHVEVVTLPGATESSYVSGLQHGRVDRRWLLARERNLQCYECR